MPYYDYKCGQCGTLEAQYRKIEDRDAAPIHCRAPMTRIISAPAIQVDIPAYVSPASGKVINSRAQRKEDLLREGCVENEPGLKEHIAATSLYEQEKAFRPVSAAIDKEVTAMVASGVLPS